MDKEIIITLRRLFRKYFELVKNNEWNKLQACRWEIDHWLDKLVKEGKKDKSV